MKHRHRCQQCGKRATFSDHWKALRHPPTCLKCGHNRWKAVKFTACGCDAYWFPHSRGPACEERELELGGFPNGTI